MVQHVNPRDLELFDQVTIERLISEWPGIPGIGLDDSNCGTRRFKLGRSHVSIFFPPMRQEWGHEAYTGLFKHTRVSFKVILSSKKIPQILANFFKPELLVHPQPSPLYLQDSGTSKH